MKSRGIVLLSLAGWLALGPPPAAGTERIQLLADRGATSEEVLLDWSGGTGPYRVFRGPLAPTVVTAANLLGETAATAWSDTTPAEDVWFYQVATAPTVFRLTDLDLRDPHAFVNIVFCVDVTDGPAGSSLNDQLQTAITMDTDVDGLLDLSVLLLFRPLDQQSATGSVELGLADCTAPLGTTVCDAIPDDPPESTTYTNVAMGSCLEPYPGTTSGYAPPVGTTGTPPDCFVSEAVSFQLDLAGAAIPLQDVQVAANYDGDPATALINGLLRGFISEELAETAQVSLGTLGTVPLASLFPGGTGNCAFGDDRDVGLDGVTVGWWIYFNFTAVSVPYVGP